MLDNATIFILIFILAFSYATETCLGFGSNVIALSIALFFVPLQTILPVLILIGVLQSFWNMFRSHETIQWRMILINILPVAFPAMILGIFLRDQGNALLLVGLLGFSIVLLATLEIKFLVSYPHEIRPLSFYTATTFVLVGGLFHGLFASGGPPIVYYAGRKITDPSEFRSTLSTLWQILNIPLLFSFWINGQIGLPEIKLSGILLPGFIIGATIGTMLKFKTTTFKLLTWCMLLFVGFAQIGKSIFSFIKI